MDLEFEFEDFIDELIVEYVKVTYLEPNQFEIFRSFSLLESFGVKFYQDGYRELIVNPDIDSMNRQDLFITDLIEDINNVIVAHSIRTVDTTSLYEANEILTGISHINSLEDKTLIAYRANASDSPLMIAVDILSMVCYLKTSELLMLLVGVDEQFIDAVRELCQEPEDDAITQDKHEMVVKLFSSMLGDTESAGISLVKKGVGLGNSLEENIELLDFDLIKYISSLHSKDTPQCAVDILSLLLISKDAYQMPLMYLEKYSYLIFKNTRQLNKIKPVIVKMFQDFDQYKETALKAVEGRDQ